MTKKKSFQKFIFISFQGLRQWLLELVVGSLSTELSEMTPNGRPTVVTRGDVWSFDNFFIQTREKECIKSW